MREAFLYIHRMAENLPNPSRISLRIGWEARISALEVSNEIIVGAL